AMSIGLLSIQMLTTIYRPGHFRILSVYTALLLIQTPLMTLRFELAVPLPGTGGAATTLMEVTTSVLLLMTIILGTLIWIAGPALLAWTSMRSEEHTSELQSRENLVCRLLLEKKKKNKKSIMRRT